MTISVVRAVVTSPVSSDFVQFFIDGQSEPIGATLSNPGFPENEVEEALAVWLETNTPEPFVAPPEPTTEEKINELLSDYGLTRAELVSALTSKTGSRAKSKEAS